MLLLELLRDFLLQHKYCPQAWPCGREPGSDEVAQGAESLWALVPNLQENQGSDFLSLFLQREPRQRNLGNWRPAALFLALLVSPLFRGHPGGADAEGRLPPAGP